MYTQQYSADLPALLPGSTVWFRVNGCWQDGVVTECESYLDTPRPYATICYQRGNRRGVSLQPVDACCDLDEMLDRDPAYASWLRECDRADWLADQAYEDYG